MQVWLKLYRYKNLPYSINTSMILGLWCLKWANFQPVWILAVNGAPGTCSLLKVMLMMWSVPSRGTKLTMKRAEPWGWTCVGMLRPLALIVISRLPSPERKHAFVIYCFLSNGHQVRSYCLVHLVLQFSVQIDESNEPNSHNQQHCQPFWAL